MPWGAKPSDGVYWSDFSSVGLNLRVPIFSGFNTRAKIRKNRYSIKNNQSRLS
jgi:outer membrane protein TolC